jgi:hypothetical protein
MPPMMMMITATMAPMAPPERPPELLEALCVGEEDANPVMELEIPLVDAIKIAELDGRRIGLMVEGVGSEEATELLIALLTDAALVVLVFFFVVVAAFFVVEVAFLVEDDFFVLDALFVKSGVKVVCNVIKISNFIGPIL